MSTDRRTDASFLQVSRRLRKYDKRLLLVGLVLTGIGFAVRSWAVPVSSVALYLGGTLIGMSSFLALARYVAVRREQREGVQPK